MTYKSIEMRSNAYYGNSQLEAPTADQVRDYKVADVGMLSRHTQMQIDHAPKRQGLGKPVVIMRSPEGKHCLITGPELQDIETHYKAQGEVPPQIQLARLRLKNYDTDRKIKSYTENLVGLIRAGAIAAAGGVAGVTPLVTGIAAISNAQVSSKFNPEARVNVAGTQFGVDVYKASVTTGTPKAGMQWVFAANKPPEACEYRPFTASEKASNLAALAWQTTIYNQTCQPVDKWPATSPAQVQYSSAYLAFLQAKYPQAGYTAEKANLIIRTRRAYEAMLPPN